LAASGDLVQQSFVTIPYIFSRHAGREHVLRVWRSKRTHSLVVYLVVGNVEICCERLQFVFEKKNTFWELYDGLENAFLMGTVALYRVCSTGLVDLGFTKLCWDWFVCFVCSCFEKMNTFWEQYDGQEHAPRAMWFTCCACGVSFKCDLHAVNVMSVLNVIYMLWTWCQFWMWFTRCECDVSCSMWRWECSENV